MAVLAISVALALVEVGRIGVVQPAADLLVAAVATACFLPLHLWHLTHGLQGLRPPHAGWTLALMAVIHAVAALLIGSGWAFMLASLATSALVVVRPILSIAILLGCAAAAFTLGTTATGDPTDNLPAYLAVAVIFRSVIQFALVWLVAAAHGLHLTQAALADTAVERERGLLREDVRRSVDGRLDDLLTVARRMRRESGDPDVAATSDALARMASIARDTLTAVRAFAATSRVSASTDAAQALASSTDALTMPVGAGFATIRRARGLVVVISATVLAFPLLASIGLTGYPSVAPLGVIMPAWIALAALQAVVSLVFINGAVRPNSWLLLGGAIVLGPGLLPIIGASWSATVWVPIAIATMLITGTRRWLVFFGAILAEAVVVSLIEIGQGPISWTVWGFFYYVVINTLAAGSLIASPALVRVVTQLEHARTSLAIRAVAQERSRLSTEMHDVLGQGLAAISLKSDLALRLMCRDPEAARREVDDVIALAERQQAEIDTTFQIARPTSVLTEAPQAATLLRGMGIDVELDVSVGRLPDAQDSLLGWAVREGTANVLRHSRARHCSISLAHEDGHVRLQLVNDGVDPGPARAGTGLGSLAERFASMQGRLSGTPTHDGRFRLHAELPAAPR